MLADARAKVPEHKEEAAIEASTVKFLSPSTDERNEADAIVHDAQPGFLKQLYDLLKGSWLPNILAVLAVILFAWVVLWALRFGLRWRNRTNTKWRHGKWGEHALALACGMKTRWTLAPLLDEKNLGATELVMDALARLPIELKEESENPWSPTSLLLWPKPPGPSEPDLLINFVNPPGCQAAKLEDHVKLVTKLQQEVLFQEVSLTDAVQQLQLSIGAYRVDSVAKFLSSVWRWLKAGSPTITGTAELCQTKAADDTVVIRLNCSGGPRLETGYGRRTDPSQTVSAKGYLCVAASTPQEDGTDIRALCADRVVFKLLYRLANPTATQAETDGQAAVRQAVMLLERCFKQNRAEETEGERRALLEKAAYNLEFARNVLEDCPRLLWMEATALALVAETTPAENKEKAKKYDSAIARFQELEVAKFTSKDYLHSLRTQALYNRAVLLARRGVAGGGKRDLAKAISVYDELLRMTDSPDAVRWLAGLGRLTVIADYESEAWKYLDRSKAEEGLEQGKALLAEVAAAKERKAPAPSLRDQRMLDLIALEANRALGKCSLRFAEAFLAEGVLKDGRPVRREFKGKQVLGPEPSKELKDRLGSALTHLERCGDDADLLVDRAYIMLLLGDHQEAENHARRAMLWNPDSEHAYYLAAEACCCHGGDAERKRAEAYALGYYGRVAERTTPPGTPKLTIAAFAALCRDLGVSAPVPPETASTVESSLSKAAGAV